MTDRHRLRPRSIGSPGFTLIEVLIALFILALMASMSWQGVEMVMRTRNAAQTRLDELLRLQSVMAQWEIDLRSVYSQSIVPALHFDGRTVRLIRRQSEGPVLVTWSLQAGQWKRWCSAPLTSTEKLQRAWIDSWQHQGTEPGTLVALNGLSAWRLQYFHNSSKAWSNALSTGDQQVDGASPQVAVPLGSLPDAVRLIIELDPASGHGGKLVRDVRLIHP
jgi:general secretion pathway protein J